WVDSCDEFKIPITAAKAQEPVASYRTSKGQHPSQSNPGVGDRPPDMPEYSYEAFVDAITEFIIADDQSLNVVENPHLRRIFMLLWEDLKDSEIPHQTTIRNRIKEIWDEHLASLESEIKKAVLYILDCLSITSKIGWVTMDNATNNDTLMASLERELRAWGIVFDHVENRIR
ncbi:hypothetical protein K443DRAFT_100729, partial [Laccaria amethystina LaAM-08-1]